MKIAVTGGAGFIGTVLMTRLLDAGHDAFWLDIRNSGKFPDKGSNVDVTHQDALTEALKGVDAVYHLAAEHRDDVRPIQKYYDVNVGGAECLVKACMENGIKTIIFTSTVAVYGLDAGESTEESVPAPFNDYGQSKLDSEKVFETWAAKNASHRLVVLRLVATFGPNNRGNIYTLMDQIARGRFLMIGEGDNQKSVAYVGNVAAFLAHTLTLEQGVHIYNYADKPDLTMKDMVCDIRSSLGMSGTGPRLPYGLGLAGGLVFDSLAKITGKNFPISIIRIKKFCANTVVRANKIDGTGFVRPYTLSYGLKEMVEAEFLDTPKAKSKAA